jgi:hypothetical protein
VKRLKRKIRRAGTRALIAREWLIDWLPVPVLAGTGVTTLLLTDYTRDDTMAPFLLGIFQLGVAAAIGWERLQRV